MRVLTSWALAPSTPRTRWLPSDLTFTSRYQPVRTSWARPSASFSSVVLTCTLSPALAWRASRHTNGSPRSFSACQSHVESGPVSKPMRLAFGARDAIVSAITFGSVFTFPRQIWRPSSSTTLTAVSFCETSRPTNCVMAMLLQSHGDGRELPLLSGPPTIIVWPRKEMAHAVQEAQARGDYWQVARG